MIGTQAHRFGLNVFVDVTNKVNTNYLNIELQATSKAKPFSRYESCVRPVKYKE